MKRSLISLAVSLVLLLTFACKRGTQESTTATDTGNIKVGVFADLSGPTSGAGQSVKNAVEIARDEINQAGGINGRQLEVFVEDDKGTSEQAVAAVTKLISQDKVNMILGDPSTPSVTAAAKAQEAHVPLITLSSSDPKITQQGDYVFSVAALDSLQGRQLGVYSAGNLNAKTAAIMIEDGSDYSKSLAQAFEEEFKKTGGQVSSKQTYAAGSQSFTEQLNAIRSANPDIIYIPGNAADAGLICKQAKDLGIKSILVGADRWNSAKFFEVSGKASDGSYTTGAYSADDPSPAVRAFNSAYKKRLNNAPDQSAALAYDAIKLLADACKRAGGSNATKLREAVATTDKFPGITGTITIGADRTATRPALIFKLQDGKSFPVYRE
jgi:branched-chain amino acid transport system substrate-binding protein